MRTRSAIGVAALVAFSCSSAQADWFGSGDNVFEIEFVTIGNPGNPADTTGAPSPAGSVPYVYQIGRYEVPEEAITKANAASAAAGEPLDLQLVVQRGPRRPATSLRWLEVARFVNWLNEEKGASPAYKFDANGDFQLWNSGDVGYDPANPFRNSLSRYFLPSTDEWYKAAFYDPATESYFDFATASDADPIPVASGTDPGTAVYQQAGPADVDLAGGMSPYGTVGQSGNVAEWEESAYDLSNDSPLETRGRRGGNWILTDTTLDLSSGYRGESGLTNPLQGTGFRVATVPEPRALILLSSAGIWCLRPKRRIPRDLED